MELDTAAIAADLSIDARRLLETLARAVRDHVDEHAEQLAGGAWEEHGMGDELRDLHFEVLKRAASDAKREVGAALLALGAKATLAGNGELARELAAIDAYLEALFEQLCEHIGDDSLAALYEDRFQGDFDAPETVQAASAALERALAAELEASPVALHDPAIPRLHVLPFARAVRQALDIFEVLDRLEG
ncbi:MAG: hypothetical protein KC503_29225 [Myxococcales bacterium]|nr:hypothetical protein [Myxococcales bacterium]